MLLVPGPARPAPANRGAIRQINRAPPRQTRHAPPVIDWTDCKLVQRDSRFVSGQPAPRSQPRVLVEPLVESADPGMTPEDIAEVHDLPVDIVRALLTYGRKQSAAFSPV